MTSSPELHSDDPRFPEELHDLLTKWYCYVFQFFMAESCPLSDRPESEVRTYLEQHVYSAVHQLGGVMGYYTGELLGSRDTRVYYVTHFTPETEPEVRRILREAGITWPLKVYKMESGEKAINIVECIAADSGPRRRRKKRDEEWQRAPQLLPTTI